MSAGGHSEADRGAIARRRVFRDYLLSIAATALTLAIRSALTPWIHDRTMVIVFLIPILISAHIGGLGPGLVATAISVVGIDFFLLQPFHSLFIASGVDRVQMGLLTLVGTLVSLLSASARRANSPETRRALEDANAQLRNSEQRLQMFIDHAPVAIALLDRELRYLAASQRWIQDYKLTGTPLLGRSHYEVFPEVPERWKIIHQRALAGEIVRSEADCFPRADGRTQWLRWEIRPWRGPDEQIAGILIFSEDITVRMQEDEMRDRLATIVASSDDAIIGKALDGTITSWNRGAEKLFGYTAAEAIGKPLRFLIPEERWDEENYILERIGRGERVEHFETERMCRDGRRIDISATISPVYDSEGRVLGASKIARDVTLQKRALRTIRESEERLEAVTENLAEGLILADLEGRPLHWNRAALRLYGIADPTTARSVLTHLPEFFELLDSEGRRLDENEWPLLQILRGEVVDGLELEVRRVTDGWTQTFSYNGKVVWNAGEHPVAFLSITDITARAGHERRVTLLAEISRRLVVSDTPRALLGSIFAELTEVIGADAFLNYWVAPSGDRLILEVSGGITEEQKSAFAELKMGEAVSGKVAASREPTILSDIQHDPDPQAEQLLRLGLRTYAVLPILTGEHLIGTVSFASSRVDRFDPEDLQVMKAVADQVAAALERSSLVEELRVSNERFRTLVEQAADAMMVYDTEGRLVDVNPQACDNLGYSRAELIGLSLQDVVVDFNLQRAQAAWARARDHGHQTITTVHRRRDGSTFPVEVRFGTIQFDHRELIIGQVRDTTERSRAEAAIRESEERFRQVVENIEEVFWMTDVAQSRLLYISPGFERIWGRTSRELYASLESWIDTVHPEDRARILRAAREKQVMGDYDETYRIVRPDGTVRWIHETAYPVRDGAGAVSRIVGVAADITEQRQLETQVRQAQKMEAIGTLAGGIAHDFNNILGAIIGFAELARLKLANYPEAYGEIDGVLEGARRAAGLVGQILASSRRQEPRRVPVQLCQVVAESLRLLRATLPSGIEFDIRLPSTLPAVLADPDQVHQVVMNLCTNASQAIGKETGRLTVSAELLTIDDLTRATHAGLRVGPYVRLSVSDTGCGMDRATLERIFEPFFTTKAPGEGTGLGLSVVHGIMKAHDGTVTVYSQPGQGTTFHLYFPANTIAGQAAIPPTPLAARGQGQRILVLDDERPLALLGKRILEELGYLATFHTDAEQAIADVVENPDRFHMIITDLTMPRLSGLEVSRQIHALQPALPILLTTGYPGTLSARDLAETGILQILLKPLTVAALAAAVDEGLASSKS